MSELTIKSIFEIEDLEYTWDYFVENESVNGTFLQTRNFLNYHPKGRFEDASILIYHKNKIVAVLPAVNADNNYCLFSHAGSTFGGPVISKKYYTIDKVLEIINYIEKYAVEKKYKQILLKPTNDLFTIENSDLLRYCLKYCGYSVYEELTSYIDLEQCESDIKKGFDRNKQRNIKKCESYNLIFKELNYDEIPDFFNLLTINLSKYNLKPIHTVEEMIEFKKARIPKNVKFFGLFEGEIMRAGGMLFLFPRTNVLHAQNLSTDYTFTEYSAITYMYYKVIEYAKNAGYAKLSWGISTEDRGRVLNSALARNKESYGSKYLVNYIYEKFIS